MQSLTTSPKKFVCFTLCAVVCLAATAFADSGVQAALDPDVNGAQKTLEDRLTKTISVEFRKTAIEDVLRIVADQADVDIVKSPKVTGEVTVTLTDVPLEEALNNILSVHGFTYVLSQNMIRVITSEEQAEKPEVLHTQTFEIVYADVEEVVKALDKFKSQKGSVSFIKGTSHIIVTDTETKMREIELFIQKVDRRTLQVLVEARIYDVTSKDSFEVNADWQIGRNTPISTVSGTDTVTKTGNTTSSTSSNREVTAVGETGPTTSTTRTLTTTGAAGPTTTTVRTVTDTIDTVTPANTGVVDEIVTTTTSGTAGTTTDTTTAKTTSGTAGTTGDTTVTTTTTGNSTGIASSDQVSKTISGTWLNNAYRKSKPFMGGGFDKDEGGVIKFGLLNSAVDLEFTLSLLQKQIGAKLLANPRVLVLDNEKALFKAIREIPYQELQESQAGGSIGTTAFREVGVELEVTPHVALADNMVRLILKPTFSVEGEDVDVAGVNVTYTQPSVDRRETETTLLVKSGQTVVLAGLRKKEVSQDIRKVPLLGDMPLIKKLFRYESEEDITSELVVFVTTWIIEEPELTDGERNIYGSTDFGMPKVPLTRIEKRHNK
ncbi:MAG: hypothetical protein JW720_14020 [Sedimentisphaerales bacterium]|nr:hypothetical protein [Sedimentisphaerales bacterium]